MLTRLRISNLLKDDLSFYKTQIRKAGMPKCHVRDGVIEVDLDSDDPIHEFYHRMYVRHDTAFFMVCTPTKAPAVLRRSVRGDHDGECGCGWPVVNVPEGEVVYV